MNTPKFKPGDRVIVNGNEGAVIIQEYTEGMYNVRLWDDSRHIGDICVDAHDIKPFIRRKEV